MFFQVEEVPEDIIYEEKVSITIGRKETPPAEGIKTCVCPSIQKQKQKSFNLPEILFL